MNIDWSREIDSKTILQLLQETEAKADELSFILLVSKNQSNQYLIEIRGLNNALELVGELGLIQKHLLDHMPSMWRQDVPQ